MTRRALTACSLAFLVTGALNAQEQTSAPDSGRTYLKVQSQLVVVDVTVRDSAGQPVHGLECRDFELKDEKTPQRLQHCEEHRPNTKAVAAAPPLPPNTFVNYTSNAPREPWNVVLLDLLNTDNQDLGYVRSQLRMWAAHADPNSTTAVFALTRKLSIVQSFTSDPNELQLAVAHGLDMPSAAITDNPNDPVANPSASDRAVGSLGIGSASNSQQSFGGGGTQAGTTITSLEASASVQSAQSLMTLDAFNVLARYLSSFPGRKNVVWISGGFPLQLGADAVDASSPSIGQDLMLEYKRTMNLLTRAQVAIYSVDATGLGVPPSGNVSNLSQLDPKHPNAGTRADQKWTESRWQHQGTLDTFSNGTGANAAYNSNGLALQTAAAIKDGASFYTLYYAPTDRRTDGAYHRIQVSLTGARAKERAQLSHRPGYFAQEKGAHRLEAATVGSEVSHRLADLAAGYGAPPVNEIPFKMEVTPTSNTEREASASDHIATSLKGPFRRFDIHLVALPASFTFRDGADGKHNGGFRLTVRLYDAEGKVANIVGTAETVHLTDSDFATSRETPVRIGTSISIPTRGEYRLHVVLEDQESDHVGSMEIAVDRVRKLPIESISLTQ